MTNECPFELFPQMLFAIGEKVTDPVPDHCKLCFADKFVADDNVIEFNGNEVDEFDLLRYREQDIGYAPLFISERITDYVYDVAIGNLAESRGPYDNLVFSFHSIKRAVIYCINDQPSLF
jgi:hypothetical protein